MDLLLFQNNDPGPPVLRRHSSSDISKQKFGTMPLVPIRGDESNSSMLSANQTLVRINLSAVSEDAGVFSEMSFYFSALNSSHVEYETLRVCLLPAEETTQQEDSLHVLCEYFAVIGVNVLWV